MKSIRERQEERREQKLGEIRRKVETGALVIRQMTPKERKMYPALPPKARSR
jgi:hypothetical protein